MIANVEKTDNFLNLGAYIQLTKPSIIYLLVLTAATAMFLVDGFETNIYKALTGIFGIGLIAASSAAINQILDFYEQKLWLELVKVICSLCFSGKFFGIFDTCLIQF